MLPNPANSENPVVTPEKTPTQEQPQSAELFTLAADQTPTQKEVIPETKVVLPTNVVVEKKEVGEHPKADTTDPNTKFGYKEEADLEKGIAATNVKLY